MPLNSLSKKMKEHIMPNTNADFLLGKDFTFLIVDDLSGNLDVLQGILEFNGFSVKRASNGMVALEILKYFQPDMILLDINMPEIDGYEVCSRIRNKKETSEIPVIFLTSLSETEDIVKGFEVGGQDYLIKPFNEAELLARISTHLQLQQQKKELALKNTDITASITYAKLLQDSMLIGENIIQSFFPESFLIFNAKDIVSGDFYFVHKIENDIVVAVADCTGHGVPGAMLQVLGYSLLNQIVKNQNIVNPYQILSCLDNEFCALFKQNCTDDVVIDGMDMLICRFNLKHKKLVYSGGKRPLYYFQNNELIVVSGGKKTIGGIVFQEKTFENKEIELKQTSTFYLFTDGIVDQFGGSSQKKFGTKKLKLLLENLQPLSMQEQKCQLENHLQLWMGSNSQLDDITIMGIRI